MKNTLNEEYMLHTGKGVHSSSIEFIWTLLQGLQSIFSKLNFCIGYILCT